MSLGDRTLERTNPDWRLYVSDFDDWVAAWLHVAPTARLRVEQQASPTQGQLVAVMVGPHCHLMLPRAVASRLRELLDVLFSAGASMDEPPSPVPSGTAPAEPSSAECER